MSLKDLFHELTRPFRVLFGIAAAITGASFFGLLAVIGTMAKNIQSLADKNWYIALFILISSLVIGIFTLALIAILTLAKTKLNASQITNATESLEKANTNIRDANTLIAQWPKESKVASLISKIKEAAGQLDMSTHNNKVSHYILQDDQVLALESSAKADTKIIVLTSKFKLDGSSLVDIILDNIRKGATYCYLVPDDDELITGFKKICSIWWKQYWEYICKLRDKIDEEGINKAQVNKKIIDENINFSEDYKTIIQKALNDDDIETVKEEALKYFCAHVEQYIINREHSLVTIIMYQQEPGLVASTPWEVIMKLPTGTIGAKYYAFKIPDEEERERRYLINRIMQLRESGKHSDVCKLINT